ncbi:MAG: helix-turn-helix transcriptional regulator [Burkholderiaceae bacterium]|nr:helix-turn-helix transcriptional regulator [Rhodoferax sp.]MCP5269627.1 helix-turn-helix transcriptional regulator [Burkholderiaceae bacterium]
MDYPIQTPGQLSSHLRALRKARGLSQMQLGAALGVGQTRVTRIERDPTAISVGQFFELLNALGAQMVLRPSSERSPASTEAPEPRPTVRAAGLKRRPTSDNDSEPW